MIGSFYKRKEVATRISILYAGNILSTAFSGLIAAGIFEMRGVRGLAGWRWFFILTGACTFLIALIAIFVLPDRPDNTWWLTPEERLLAASRIKLDTVEESAQISVWKGLKEAAKDPRLYLFALMQNQHLSANGFKNFFPTVVETLGFSRNVTLALTCPPYVLAWIFSVAVSITSGRMNERTWHITGCKAIAIFGFVLGMCTLNLGARYFAMVVFCVGTYGVNSIVLGWVSSTLGQTAEKRSISLAIVNTFANLSFVYTPYLWRTQDQPRYVLALSTSAAFSATTVMCAWAMRIWLKRQNKALRAGSELATNLYAY
jgi:MFS family permease